MNAPQFAGVSVTGALSAAVDRISEDDAQLAVAFALVSEICAQGIVDDFEAGWNFLVALPDYAPILLETATGWHILLEMAADAFGTMPSNASPSIH